MLDSRRRFLKYAAGTALAAGVASVGSIAFFSLVGRISDRAENVDDLSEVSEPGDYELSVIFDGLARSYLLHLPPTFGGETPLPLVIALHGGGGNARSIITTTGMNSKADEEGFIAVYPNGTGRLKDRFLTWNAGNCCGYAIEENIDDVGFLKTLMHELSRELNVNQKRIYATGMSNGAMMSYGLACGFSEKLAAIAPVAGPFNYEQCRPSHPVSVIIFHGTADEHVPYNGGVGAKARMPRVDKPVSYAVSFWAKHNGCSEVPQIEEAGNIRRETYTGGARGTEVVLYTIVGGGHAWPGGSPAWPFGDEPTREISATDTIWEFFASHPKL